VRWANDFAVLRTFDLPRPHTLAGSTGWGGTAYEGRLAATDARWFTIYARDGWRPIGQTDLFDIDWRSRAAMFGILIGEAEGRGQGYGTEATRLMLDYAFATLGLHSVALTVYEFNLAGLRAYARAGFRECGRRRQCRWLGGRLWDEVYMDCLASEFTSPLLAQVGLPSAPRPPGDSAAPPDTP
jgi:RimJ/RimL family protein N-acetyltransferase